MEIFSELKAEHVAESNLKEFSNITSGINPLSLNFMQLLIELNFHGFVINFITTYAQENYKYFSINCSAEQVKN